MDHPPSCSGISLLSGCTNDDNCFGKISRPLPRSAPEWRRKGARLNVNGEAAATGPPMEEQL
jgi:hypothetical protein